ncbi:carboxypeptidase regulatory-like domain-containing protein [Flavobacterium alkalisoli]|uniref:Carboxypeptidase regulatory-like domain-containing protein n=1 Tax=Flavobacterium alkalisoli TaxID=2602769 RepID=A0A5B9FRT2_9FLAO|nr:carboxypeptidase regulatory-like domain-containing protein [Flavobacterium alkalisoli]QEE49605.1 carboxypeptidase regulatory-like domain-containing protein [Flavobacterium alkalisoli]
MPYKISGKVVGDDGYPIYQQALIAELNNQGQQVANILSSEETGSYVFFAENENSTIRISSPGYKEQIFLAKAVPSEITLYPLDSSVINFTRPKPDRTGLYLALGTLAAVAITAIAIGRKDKKAKAQDSKPKAKPVATAKPKVKTVTV